LSLSFFLFFLFFFFFFYFFFFLWFYSWIILNFSSFLLFWFSCTVADDWDIWLHLCLYACEGLLPAQVLEVGKAYVEGYQLHTQGNLTAGKRVEAKGKWKTYGLGCQEIIAITACTLATHQATVEADGQVEACGPLPETMASWVERVNCRVTEYVRRIGVRVVPETTIVRSYLLDLFAVANAHLIPKPRIPDYDIQDEVGIEPRARVSLPSLFISWR